MSDGKKFGPGPILDGSVDPIERITELERLWPLIQQKLQAYDQVISDFKAFRNEVDSLKSSIFYNANALNEANERHSNLQNFLDSKFSSVAQAMSEFQPKIDALSNMNQELRRNFESKSDELVKNSDNIKSNFQELFSSVAKNAEVEFLKDFLEKKFNSVSSEISSLQMKYADASVNFSNMQSQVTTNKNDVAEIAKSINVLSDQFVSVLNAMESLKTYFSTQISAESTKVRQDVELKMNTMKESLSGSPASLEALKGDILKKLEGIQLDGSNAVLKASNSSQQIVILEKKIENIYLLLKKLELSK